jgi:translation initiation factor 2B subunit (eIF-2B alpha/beta/delta family)
MSDGITSQEMREMFKEMSKDIQDKRHENNNHISEVLGEIRIEQGQLRDVVLNLEKNNITVTNVCANVEKAVKYMKEELKTKCDENASEIKAHRKEFYEHDAIKNHNVDEKRISDLEGQTAAQETILRKHTIWFALAIGAGFVLNFLWNSFATPVAEQLITK